MAGREINFSHKIVRWTKDLIEISNLDFGHTITRIISAKLLKALIMLPRLSVAFNVQAIVFFNSLAIH